MKRLAITITLVALSGLIVFYVLFNWTMSALVHSRRDVMIPDISGKSLNDAISALSAVNLGLKKESEEFDQNVPAGVVIRQSPPAGMTVKEGKLIKVTVSQGGQMVYVPNVVGQMTRAAEIGIRSSGLTLGEETTRYSVVVEKDRVISQDPAAGAAGEKDTIVNLVVSAGQPPSDVRLMPSFTGRDISAVKAWADLNRISVAFREEPVAGMQPGAVISQDPEPDTDLATVQSIVVVLAGGGAAGQALDGKVFYYQIPQSSGEKEIRLSLMDDAGESEIFRGVRPPGTKLELPVHPRGSARVRIFVNGILVEEREIQ
jgi:serine/threonine-protein kinase